ncbi:MAG TPA: Rieske 2Fe-2S domain-containing protein [Chloroflexota bacterium]|jgi:5,5'-dehydrodivanillate O-demethylase
MLTQEENELLTSVGPGTPCGALLRRYWHPACFVGELTDDRPAKRVKIMGEDLVFFRDKQGSYGCVAEHCAHQGVSLAYGFVEDCGIRCPYHGWKYDARGNCLEQPFEPPGSNYKDRVKQTAYPVEELAGILFVYMGPAPAPLLPRWDVLARPGGLRKLIRRPLVKCNWMQIVENSADVTHTYYLHGHMLHQQGARGVHVDYYYRPIKQYGFQPFEWGLLKSWSYVGNGGALGDETGGGNPLIFPAALSVLEHPWHSMHFRVPMDDTHTWFFWVGYLANPDPNSPAVRHNCAPDCPACARIVAGEPQDPHNPLVHKLPVQYTEDGEYPMDAFFNQDLMAFETQGPRLDRAQEHLGASDRGIVLYRQMLREQIEVVQRGEDPLGVIRDPTKNTLIEIPVWVAEVDAEAVAARGGGRPVEAAIDDVFDARHEVFVVDPRLQPSYRA